LYKLKSAESQMTI